MSIGKLGFVVPIKEFVCRDSDIRVKNLRVFPAFEELRLLNRKVVRSPRRCSKKPSKNANLSIAQPSGPRSLVFYLGRELGRLRLARLGATRRIR